MPKGILFVYNRSMKKIIAVVEDEKDLNELVSRYLEKEGFQVVSFLDYDQAYQYLENHTVHLWVLDIMLKDKSGFDLMDEIRHRNSKTPVIFMSARDQEIDRILGLEKGSDDYITKPFSPKELVLRVLNVMKRSYPDSKCIEVDGYRIDEEKRVVMRGDKQIELTTKEFELMILFVEHRGIAFSREQILTQVWDDHYFGSDRVVDDTLRRLRKKCPDLNIHTIYGYGYRLG